MNKELEYIRKAVIMACHADSKNYEEALEKEKNNQLGTMSKDDFRLLVADGDLKEMPDFFCQSITLAKILITLGKYWGNIYAIDSGGFFIQIGHYGECYTISDGKYDLTKDLDAQKPETILAISKLLGYND